MHKAGNKLINRLSKTPEVVFIYSREVYMTRVKYNKHADPNLIGSFGFTLNEALLLQFIKVRMLQSLLSRDTLNRLVNKHFLESTGENVHAI